MIEVRSRVHRILKPMSNFLEVSEGSELPSAFRAGFTLDASEEALGIYINDVPGSSRDAIVFTTEGLYVHRDRSWLRVSYSNIERTIPPAFKSEVTGFNILLRDSSEIWLSVTGSRNGRFYDAFEILRFLDRVKGDVAQQ